ncbi:MAG: 2-oxoacid ferredoxin oxidoreductase [Candidatus Saganbacteria bacterium]|nr:2-oxoacid ferredoxin oxidoreductase [Candidatus Saganbacteria bacterium]
MPNKFEIEKNIDIAWCPGCGNFPILKILKEALFELNLDPKDTVIVSGIGQAAKIPQYINANFFNGLHGRALPPATAIKAVNPALTVIAESGDGDMYGEGGNHFIHTIRRNPNITNIVHNNMVYGLTKGQASPTTEKGFVSPVQVNGVILEPFNPIAVAISLGASFVARAFCGQAEQTKEIIKKAILHKGYALVDILQPCVSFNKINTYQWFSEHTYYIEDGYDPGDRVEAFRRAVEKEKLPLGIFYKDESKKTFEDQITLVDRDTNNIQKLHDIIEARKKVETHKPGPEAGAKQTPLFGD